MRKFLLAFFLLFTVSAQASEPVRFCRPLNMVSALPYIAEAKGYFKDQGLNITFIKATSGTFCRDALLAGSTDVSIIGGENLMFMTSTPLNVSIFSFLQKSPEMALYVRKDHGITSVKDIKGKTIGWWPGWSYFYTLRLLEKYNLNIGDVHFKIMQAQTMLDSFKAGTIDGFVSWEPWGSNALTAVGDNGLRLADKVYSPSAVLATGNNFMASHPEILEKILRALIQAQQDIKAHPAEDMMRLSDMTGMDKSIMARNWDNYDHTIHLDQTLVQSMVENFAYLKKYEENYKDQPLPDIKKIINPSILRSIDPNLVKGF